MAWETVLIGILTFSMHHLQQNKWYPQKCLLAHFEATLDLNRTNSHNNISQICYSGQISLQSAVVSCIFSDNLTTLGVLIVLLSMVPSIYSKSLG